MIIRLALAILCVVAGSFASAGERFILLQSTTSTENSGLFDYLLPLFQSDTGIAVRVVAVGTGQAIHNAENGDGDVLLVHAKAAEEAFVASGNGIARYDVMYNDFVLVGPKDDPAGVSGQSDIIKAFTTLATQRAPFVSRGDDSGTHKAERRLWRDAGINASDGSGEWYRETGSGMGASLNTAVAMGAYILTDRATWIAFGNKGKHQIMSEGDPRLLNQYGVIRVNEALHPHVKSADAQAFVDWLLSPRGQDAIAAFRVGGHQLFHPNASHSP